MNLLKVLVLILATWRDAFCKSAAHNRAIGLAIACLCAHGKKTVTSMAIFLDRGNKLPIADYKFYTECKWNVEDLFNPILNLAMEHISDDYICVGADDTKIRKTGKKLPCASWQADPLGPKFQTNLIWAIRYLQMSVLLPLYSTSTKTPARAIPVRFTVAPAIKKPGKKSTLKDWEEYKKLSKEKNLSKIFVHEVLELRKTLNAMGFANKKLIMSCDGSFCNKTCMNIEDSQIIMLARCRKDAKLCFQSTKARKVYDDKKFTPEEVRKDETIQWQVGTFFYGGEWREVKYKEVREVLWQHGTKRKALRLIVLAPLPYVRGGKRNYRDPGYLLVNNAEEAPIKTFQAYLDRLQIEYNHRDEKSILGVGEAQVWNEESIRKQPSFHVAAYSALLMANIIVYKDLKHPDFGEKPSWRPEPKRNTCRALIGLLREAIITHKEEVKEMGIKIADLGTIYRQAA